MVRLAQVAGNDTDLCTSALSPTCLYQGDQIFLQAYAQTTNVTVNYNANGSYVSGRFVPNLTVQWIREGP